LKGLFWEKMNEICQLASSVASLRYLVFSLTGFLAFATLAGGYLYLGSIRMVINQTIALINSFLGLMGAGVIGSLFFVNRFLC